MADDKKKICVVSPIHPADDIRIFNKEIKSYIHAGFEVKLFARPVQLNQDMTMLDFHPLPIFKSRLVRFLYLVVLTYRLLLIRGHIFHFHNPDCIPLALLLKCLGRTVIYETHENFYFRVKMRKWIPKYLRNVIALTINAAEHLVCKVVDIMIVTQDRQLFEFGSSNVLCLPNAPIFVETKNERSSKRKGKDAFRLVYLGYIDANRRLSRIIDQLPELNESFEVRLELIGFGDEVDLQELKSSAGWKYVNFYGKLSQTQAFEIAASSDIGIVLLPDIGDYKYTTPNKLFEYSMLGIPFIASDFAYWRDIYHDVDAGIFIESSNLEKFFGAVRYLYSDPVVRKKMGANGYEFIQTRYNWKLFSDQLIQKIVEW